MKKKLYLFTLLLIMLGALLQLNAQEWLVYDMDVLPEDTDDPFDWSKLSDNSPGADYYHYIIADLSMEGNNLMVFGHPGTSKTMYNWEMDNVPSDTSVTVVLRMKGDDVDFDRLCDINIRNGKWREEIRIDYDDGKVEIKNTDNGSVALVEGNVPGTVMGWHIYRIVLDVDTISVYIDEGASPVTKGVMGRSSNDTYVKIGDGSGDEIGSIIDWIMVDTSGAYAPGEGAAIPDSLATNTEKSIIFVAPYDEDDPMGPSNREVENIEFLQRQGFNVSIFWPPDKLGAAGQDTIDLLNAADLVIIGRSGGSTNFQKDVDVDAWNSLTSPQMLICQWKARRTRMKYFNSTAAGHENVGPPVAYGVVTDPDDPVFDGVTLVGDSMGWFAPPPHDFIRVDSATNGDVLAKWDNNAILLARFDAGTPFYVGAVDTAGTPQGPRTYFGMGNDDTKIMGEKFSNFFPLTKDAKKVIWLKYAG